MNEHPSVYLFVHVIWSVNKDSPLLSKPVRRILFAHMQRDAGEKGIRILTINGVEDHLHCLVQLLAAQNLSQVVKSIRTASSSWLNENKLLPGAFEWEEGYTAYSVSPSSLQQVTGYIDRQEEHHKTKTLESELEAFEKLKESL